MRQFLIIAFLLAAAVGRGQTFYPLPDSWNSTHLPFISGTDSFAHTVDSVPNPPDSIWHLKGTHKKVRRRFEGEKMSMTPGAHGVQTDLGPVYVYDTTSEAFLRKLDTIDVWRMVCDTTPGFGHGVKLMGLKEVRESYNEAEGVIDPGFYLGKVWHDYWRHLKYLTAAGRCLPKGMAVIETDAFLANQEPEYAVTPDAPPAPDTGHLFSLGAPGTYFLPGHIDTAATWYYGDSITRMPSTVYWSNPKTVTLDASWLPRRFRKRHERYLKKHKPQQ